MHRRHWAALALLIGVGLAQAGTRGTLAKRPAATQAAAEAIYVVTDCASTTCVAGGVTMSCLTQNTGEAWVVVVCGTTSTSTSSTTTTSTSTTVTTTTAP